jgi:hypothetical protein
MATLKTVERNIGNLEGFDVVIKHPTCGPTSPTCPLTRSTEGPRAR